DQAGATGRSRMCPGVHGWGEERETAEREQELEARRGAVGEPDLLRFPVLGADREAPDTVDGPECCDQQVAGGAEEEQRPDGAEEREQWPGELGGAREQEEDAEQRVFLEVALRDRQVDR